MNIIIQYGLLGLVLGLGLGLGFILYMPTAHFAPVFMASCYYIYIAIYI